MKRSIRVLLPLGAAAAAGTGLLLTFGRLPDPRAERERAARTFQAGRDLGHAALAYANAHGDRYPPARNWEAALRPYLPPGKDPVPIPARPDDKPRRFALNSAIAGKRVSDIEPASAALFFESVAPGPSAADPLLSLPRPPADGKATCTVIYGDTHGYSYPANWPDILKQPMWRKRIVEARD